MIEELQKIDPENFEWFIQNKNLQIYNINLTKLSFAFAVIENGIQLQGTDMKLW